MVGWGGRRCEGTKEEFSRRGKGLRRNEGRKNEGYFVGLNESCEEI